MEYQARTSTGTDYPVTSEQQKTIPNGSGVTNVSGIYAESQENAQTETATVLRQHPVRAETILHNPLWEYALLQGNERDGDAVEATQAANDVAAALQFISLFRESFATFHQSAEFNRLHAGEQAKWRPTLRDTNGQIVGELNHVLLNPILPQVGQKPVVQLILPNRDYVAEVSRRLRPDQQRAAENGQPISCLERPAKPENDETVQAVMTLMTPANAGQRGRVEQAMQEYRQAQANIKPDDVTGLRQAFGQIVAHTLNVEGFRRDAIIDKMLEVNTLYRITYHPDIDALGRQPIHLQTVPLEYKGVSLQPPQIRNLLLGNSIEVAGIRDERRPGLYRASVRFNVLSNKMESGSAREEIKTDNKAEYTQHQQLVHRKEADDAPRQVQTGQVAQRPGPSLQPETIQRPAFRLGR